MKNRNIVFKWIVFSFQKNSSTDHVCVCTVIKWPLPPSHHFTDDKSGKSYCLVFGLIWYVGHVMYLSYIWWKELKYPLPVHKSPMLDPVLSHKNPANILKFCLFNVNVNINLLCAPGSLMWYYSFRFRKHFVSIDLLLPACYNSCLVHPQDFR
jgi:hypothetical protein